MARHTKFLDRLLDPVGRALTPEAARQLLAIRADAETQALMEYLAERANEGLLTPEEREDYEALLSVANLIGILQAKARMVLAGSAA